MILNTEYQTDFFEVIDLQEAVDVNLSVNKIEEGLCIYTLSVRSTLPTQFSPLTLRCKVPAKDVLGVWHPNALQDKRLRADWEDPSLMSRSTVGAPVISAFGHGDTNCLTIACSDSIHPIQLGVPVREENNLLYGTLIFFLKNYH